MFINHALLARMKTNTALFLMLLVSTAGWAQSTIEVTVTKVRPGSGNIRVGLFNEANFMGTPVEGKEVKADSESVVLKFENVADGDYAISVIHDANENGDLDKTKLGIPKEGFAFSHDVMGKKGPPPFQKAKFEVKGATVKQQLTMRYP